MPKLEDLQKSLLQLTPDELRDRIRQIRTERRIYKEPRRVKKAKAVKSDNVRSTMQRLLDAMSPAEREQFLRNMESEP